MYQPLITFCPHPAIFTQVLPIFAAKRNKLINYGNIQKNLIETQR